MTNKGKAGCGESRTPGLEGGVEKRAPKATRSAPTLQRKALGSTEVMIPEIGLGVWRYSGGVEPLQQGIALGACLIDTAEIYGTEDVVGQVLKG